MNNKFTVRLLILILLLATSCSKEVTCPSIGGIAFKNKKRIPYVNASNCIDGKYYHKWLWIVPAKRKQQWKH